MPPRARWWWAVSASVAVVAGAFATWRALAATELDGPLLPFVARSHTEGRLYLATRTLTGVRGQIECIQARDGSKIWATATPNLGSAYMLAVGDGVVASAKTDRVFALDAATGAPRWDTAMTDVDGVWIDANVVVARTRRDSIAKLAGLSAADGTKLWESAAIDTLADPVFAGPFALIPTERATVPALRVVDVRDGRARTIGAGLGWPGSVHGGGYVTAYAEAPAVHGALVTQEALRDPEAAMAKTEGTARLDLPGAVTGIVVLDPASGAVQRVTRARSECARAGFSSVVGERYLCDEESSHVLMSRPISGGPARRLEAPEGYRFSGGGRPPGDVGAARFVPVVLGNERTEGTKVCVVDLSALAFTWCAPKDVPSSAGMLVSWTPAMNRGAVSVVLVPRATPEGDDALMIVEGATGALRTVVSLHSDAAAHERLGWEASEWSASDQVLLGFTRGTAWALDATTGAVAWKRGNEAITAVDARATVEAQLGSLPATDDGATTAPPEPPALPDCLALDADDVAGEPVTLDGTLRLAHPASPPEAFILTFDAPRAVCGVEGTTSIPDVQLLPKDDGSTLRLAAGKRVRVAGDALPRYAATHLRPVVVDVRTLEVR